jgi:hypothetical protein
MQKKKRLQSFITFNNTGSLYPSWSSLRNCKPSASASFKKFLTSQGRHSMGNLAMTGYLPNNSHNPMFPPPFPGGRDEKAPIFPLPTFPDYSNRNDCGQRAEIITKMQKNRNVWYSICPLTSIMPRPLRG